MDNSESPKDLEELPIDDESNGNLGNFLQDNGLLPDYEDPGVIPLSPNKSTGKKLSQQGIGIRGLLGSLSCGKQEQSKHLTKRHGIWTWNSRSDDIQCFYSVASPQELRQSNKEMTQHQLLRHNITFTFTP
nr:hypothetical protein [Tanacetum cinerariifolium]